MLSVFLVTAFRALRLRIEETISAYECSCEYNKQAEADSRQGVPYSLL
jgi:hypothetical protein